MRKNRLILKKERHRRIVDILRQRGASDQREIIEGLRHYGIDATQATVSRDLVDLGVVKVNGYYRLPTFSTPGGAAALDTMEMETAGDCLIVLKTSPGQAQMAGLSIDRSDIAEVVGTVAGDDTVFIAVKGRTERNIALEKIFRLFQAPGANRK